MAERQETRHSIPSYGYSFFVDNESGYDFTATLTFEPNWFNSAPGYNIEVLDPNGKLLFKEFLECLDFKDPDVFHGPSHGPPDEFPPTPVLYPEHKTIFPTLSQPVTITVPVPASDTGGVYQIRIVTPLASVNSEGRMSTVDLSLDPPLPFGWKGDMGFTDLCRKDDTEAKSGSVYFCSLPPKILSQVEPDAGLKQWVQARGFSDGSVGFSVKIFKDIEDGPDVLIKSFQIERELDEGGNRRRSWRIHETTNRPSVGLEYSVSGPEYLTNRNDDGSGPREVYRIDWENLDDGDTSTTDHAHTLLLETHEPSEIADETTSDFNPPENYDRQGATDVPLILCSDRNTAIRLNNGISYIYDEDLVVSEWDSNRIVFLNSLQKAAWGKLQQARRSYKVNIVDQGLVNTQNDPYWIGRPGIDPEGDDWDYAGAMQESIRTTILNDIDDNTDAVSGEVDWESTKYWSEDKVNRLSNAVVKAGLFEFLPCHIYEQNMDPTSPWFGVFWNWHKNIHEEIKIGGTDDGPLSNPYANVFRYLYEGSGEIYSFWENKRFPRLGPTSNLAAHLSRMYSLGDSRDDLGLGFLRDANPFYKNVGIRNRLVLALLHQLMVFDQNGGSTYWDDDYRGGGIAFTTHTIVPLLDVWDDIGSEEDDIFTGEDAVEVKDILKTAIMNHLERYAGYLNCSAHNQWVHAWTPMAKAAMCFNDSAIDFLFLRNIKISDNRYNHNVQAWQESGGYCNIYCAFAIYSLTKARYYLLKRRDNILERGEGDDILAINELSLRDLESQINSLTDYWNHTIVIEPDGSLNGAHDFNSRVDGAHWGTSPRRFLEFIGNAYGNTIEIPEMTACQTLVAYTTGRNYESWNDMYRQWQHLVPDPYGVSFNLDENTGDMTSFEEKRQWIVDKFQPSNDNPYSPTRFREPFDTQPDGHLKGLDNSGINPCATVAKPRPVGIGWMDKDAYTLSKQQGPNYADAGISPLNISNTPPPQLPAHGEPFVKLWPTFVSYNSGQIRVYTNQQNVAPDPRTRQDVGGISVKTSKYYCHIHADGWNLSNQNSSWKNRRADKNSNDPEYMNGLTPACGGGFSLFTTPENGSILCGRRKGWLGSNQVYMKRYKRDEDVINPDLGQVWNDAIDADGCGYAWAEPASDNAVTLWVPGTGDIIGTFIHKQHFNVNFLAQPTDLAYDHNSNPTFDQVAEAGGIGYIERTYLFTEDDVQCTVKIVPKRTVSWDDIYMTLPITMMGRGYYSGDAQYVQNEDARRNKNRYNENGDLFETEKNGSWKKEVFISGNKVTIGHRHFNPLGSEISFDGGVVENIDRLVSGPGTDPLYPQTGTTPIQNGNFFWPPSEQTLIDQPQLGKFGSVDDLLAYCQGGRDQDDLPVDWCVPATSGYASPDKAGKTTDDALRVHFNDSVKNWTVDTPIEFTFTITPQKDLDLAEQESQSVQRSIIIDDFPDLVKEKGKPMIGDGYTNPPDLTRIASMGRSAVDYSSVVLTRSLITDQSASDLPCHPIVLDENNPLSDTFQPECPFVSGADAYVDPAPGKLFGRTDQNESFEHLRGKGTIHVFADLDFQLEDLPQEQKDSFGYVPGSPGPGVGGCATIPLSGEAGYLMFFNVSVGGEGMGGFPVCDRNVSTYTSLQERVHIEVPFDTTGLADGDMPYFFYFHIHEDPTAANLEDVEFSSLSTAKNIHIRIDFDEVENPEWWP